MNYTRFWTHWSKDTARLDFTLCNSKRISLQKRLLALFTLGWIPSKIRSFLAVHIGHQMSTTAVIKNWDWIMLIVSLSLTIGPLGCALVVNTLLYTRTPCWMYSDLIFFYKGRILLIHNQYIDLIQKLWIYSRLLQKAHTAWNKQKDSLTQ